MAVILAVGVLPAAAMATPGTADYTMDFTDANATWGGLGGVNLRWSDASGTGWTWDADEQDLTLSGLDFTTTAAIAMVLPAGAAVILTDNTTNNIISVFDGTTDDTSGIYASGGNIAFKGGGTLNVAGGDTTLADSSGIFVLDGGMSVMNAVVNAAAGGAASDGLSAGLYCQGEDARKRHISISGGTVTATGGAARCSSGITTVCGGVVWINGGLVSAAGTGDDECYGIDCAGDAVFTGDTLKLSGKQALYADTLSLGDTPWYMWRVAGSGAYTDSLDTAYSWSRSHIYIELVATDLAITTTSLDGATAAAAYSATLQASDGTAPYTWALNSGSVLPAGLALSSNGVISGTPAAAGSFTFTVDVTDAGGVSVSKELTLVVAAAPAGPPVITDPDRDKTVSVVNGNTVTLSVTARNATAFKWQLNDGGGWADIDGASAASYITPRLTVSNNGRKYRCVVTGAGSATSCEFTVSIRDGETPETGDGSAPVLWACLAVSAAAGLALVPALKRRRASR